MDLFDEIARVAYCIFEEEGCVHGRHLEHWIQAEIIVKSRYEQQKDEPISDDKQVLETEKKDKKKASVKKASTKKPAAKKTASKKTLKD
ncbi:MAG TPA: DUF2934 domain-containing protein [Syntrophorhabdaceae bacterium]|jgi:hypothetical protein|nr:DUF2934 domain-containing protein [Syntrophorhabdaceae bacterium]MDI9561581.1 DUF2934 domain-containing protein [Pseudomonadota bacterium]OQC49764.1 MAG: hypothetical protein BWX58_00624 [Deltaproteobacteria bacterium ADurb.Bin026]MBP8699462.1 DUF2934 domain-containing protein [Syntrophorhabdaceae bacterium]MBV6506106.1 hypothetical protein [Syntrophorhabdaceae bacterium]